MIRRVATRVERSGPEARGPAPQGGGTGAAEPGAALGAAHPGVEEAGADGAAVVGKEEDDGVVREVLSLEKRE